MQKQRHQTCDFDYVSWHQVPGLDTHHVSRSTHHFGHLRFVLLQRLDSRLGISLLQIDTRYWSNTCTGVYAVIETGICINMQVLRWLLRDTTWRPIRPFKGSREVWSSQGNGRGSYSIRRTGTVVSIRFTDVRKINIQRAVTMVSAWSDYVMIMQSIGQWAWSRA